MNILKRVALLLLLVTTVGSVVRAGDARTAGFSGTPVKGKWSSPATWVGGTLPSPGDNVIVSPNDTLIADVTISLTDLTVGDGTAAAELRFSDTAQVNLTITGNVLISPLGSIRTQGAKVTSAPVIDTMFVYGDFTHQGTKLDFRNGSGPGYGVLYLVFVGSANSTLTSTGGYNSSSNEFNGITFLKTGTARVLLGSDIFLAGGSSTYPASNSYLDFKSGIVQTGNYALVAQSTTAATVRNYSEASYVIGTMGRGMASGGGSTKEFPVGDELAYRPIKIRSTTAGGGTGAFVRVKIETANANTGSSTLAGGIDKVSTVRSYKITFDKGITTSPNTMSFDRFQVGYGASDGIAAGNSNLRTAYSTDSLATWTGCGQVANVDTTRLTTPPSYWSCDSLATPVTLTSMDKSMFVAQARATGTTENSLVYTSVGVAQEPGVQPASFGLDQNYPNPFNPATTIRYQLAASAQVTLRVFDMLGREVSVLVHELQQPGTHTVSFDGAGLASGIYVYRLTAGSFSETRRMVLLK